MKMSLSLCGQYTLTFSKSQTKQLRICNVISVHYPAAKYVFIPIGDKYITPTLKYLVVQYNEMFIHQNKKSGYK